jgi:hypothetical protein
MKKISMRINIMVKTDEEWTWNAIKDLVKHLDLQVNDVKQMWAEIDAEPEEREQSFEKTMPEFCREMRFADRFGN